MKFAFVDYRISMEERLNLSFLGCKVIPCEPCNNLYPAISGHPDILMHLLEPNKLILHKGASKAFEKTLLKLHFNVIRSSQYLQSEYPNDISLNAVNTQDFFLHLLKNSDKSLLDQVNHKKLIDVKQGYTKCSTVILPFNAFITSDKSIYSALLAENADVLLLPPGDILLPGLDYGFIGGTCGLINNRTLAFYGSLDFYPHKALILNFLKKYKIDVKYLYNGPLIDRGSILIADN